MPHSLPCAGNKHFDHYTTISVMYKSTVDGSIITRVPWSVIDATEPFMFEPKAEVKTLLQELNGTYGSLCSQIWAEFWFKDYESATMFYMIYG